MSEKELTELIKKIKLRRLELGLSYQELSVNRHQQIYSSKI